MSTPPDGTGAPANDKPNKDNSPDISEVAQHTSNTHEVSKKRDRSPESNGAQDANGQSKPSDGPLEPNLKKPRKMAAVVGQGYTDVNLAVIFFDEQDSENILFSHERQKMARVFQSIFGVDRCQEIKLLESRTPGNAGPSLLESIAAFKGESPADELQIFYYGGHGGLDETTNTLRASSRDEEGGEYFDWTTELVDAIFTGASDTLLILNCCEAGGVNIRSSYAGIKHVLAACPVGTSTPAHGGAAFSNLLFVAGGLMDTQGFTLEQWFEQTTETAQETEGAARPIHQSVGTSKHSIYFEPRKWLARKKDRSTSGEDSSETSSTRWDSTSDGKDGSSDKGSDEEGKKAASEEKEDKDETPGEGSS